MAINGTLRYWTPIYSKEEGQYRGEMINKAREGDKEAQEWLYKFHGMTGILNKETMEVERWTQ